MECSFFVIIGGVSLGVEVEVDAFTFFTVIDRSLCSRGARPCKPNPPLANVFSPWSELSYELFDIDQPIFSDVDIVQVRIHRPRVQAKAMGM